MIIKKNSFNDVSMLTITRRVLLRFLKEIDNIIIYQYKTKILIENLHE